MPLADGVSFSDKVRVPVSRLPLVRRQRLLDRLHAEIHKRLLFISAPGGYGKTTLLADFATDAGFPVAWYCLEPADHELRSFARCLVEAIQQPFPRFGAQTLELISSNPDRPLDVRQFVSTLTHEIEHQAASFFALVLDDYHTVAAAEEVNQAIDLLLAHLPDNCRLIIAGRTVPSKLRLTRLAAQQQVIGFGATDLAFTVDEIREVVSRRFDVDLAEEEAAGLHKHSQGWITALLLSGSLWSSQIARHFPDFTGSASDLFNYLTEEVLSQLDIDAQRFLMETAVLGRLDPAWCDMVLGRKDSAAILERLSKDLLFVTRTEGTPHYRYHPLFHEYLEAKLREDAPDRFREVLVRAGEAAEAEGSAESAVDYYLRGQALQSAAHLMVSGSDRFMEQGKWLTLRAWIEQFDAAFIEKQPDLLLLQAQVLARTGQADRALLSVRDAERAYSQMGDAPHQAHALLVHSRIMLERGEFSEMGRLATGALSLLPEHAVKLRSEAHQNFGLSLRHQGRIAQALVEMGHALRLAEEQGDLAREAIMERSIASVYLASDQLDEADRHYRMALAIWQQLGDVPMQAAALNGLAIVCERGGDYEGAGRLYREGLQKVRDAGSYPYLEAMILRNLAEQAVDLGASDDALTLCAEALNEAGSLDANWLMSGLQVMRARAYLAQRRLREADQAAHAAHRLARRSGSPEYTGMALGWMASVAAAEARYHDAVSLFERASRLFKRAKAFRELSRSQFRYALCLAVSNEPVRARLAMNESLALAERIGQESLLTVEASHHLDEMERAMAAGLDADRLRPLLQKARLWRDRHRQPLKLVPTKPALPDLVAQAFGTPELVRGGAVIPSADWETARAKELFFLLLAHPGGLPKSQLIADLWPDASEARGNSQFHSSLYRVRRAVGPTAVVFHGGRYRVNPDLPVWYDVGHFQRQLTQAFRLPAESEEMADLCRQAVSLYRGSYMEGCYSDWVVPVQDRLQGRYFQALDRLARYHVSREEYREALEYYELGLALDNARESVHMDVMRLHTLRGEPGLAVQHYLTYVQWLRREVGETPSGQLRRAYEALLHGNTRPQAVMAPTR